MENPRSQITARKFVVLLLLPFNGIWFGLSLFSGATCSCGFAAFFIIGLYFRLNKLNYNRFAAKIMARRFHHHHINVICIGLAVVIHYNESKQQQINFQKHRIQ